MSIPEGEGLRTVSDLARIAPGMKLGVDTSWMERKGDGYRDFRRVYEFDFKWVFPMEIGLVYGAVRGLLVYFIGRDNEILYKRDNSAANQLGATRMRLVMSRAGSPKKRFPPPYSRAAIWRRMTPAVAADIPPMVFSSSLPASVR